MKKRNRLAALLMAVLTIAATAASCAQPSEGGGGSSAVGGEDTTAVETSALSTVPVADYEQFEFKILATNQDKRHVDVVAESENGSTLNDLVFRRNMKIEDLFNITISAEDMEYSQINSTISRNVSSMDNSHSMYLTNATAYSMASEGYLIALNTIEGLQLDKPWWDQDAISDMSVGGNTYLATGDITPTGLLTSECVLFNKNLFDDKSMIYPYQTAFDGEWTLDQLITLSKGLTEDLNGDSKITVQNDLYSLTCWSDYPQALFYGAGGRMVSKDEEDLPYLDWDVERITNIYQKMYDVLITNEANFEIADHERSFKVFNEGRAYFCGITFQKIEMFLRDMEDDYGVLPIPKYDINQERYMTDVSGAGTMLVIPQSITDLDIVANVTEAMAAAAYDMISPSLYDVIVSVKNVRDEESAEMVQMIIRNRVFDISHMYYLPGDDFCGDLLKQKSTNVASYLERNRSVAERQLERIIETFIANN